MSNSNQADSAAAIPPSSSTSTHANSVAIPAAPAAPPRSPYLTNSQTLSSSPSSSGFGASGPSSPSLGSSNRFGLSLGNLVRRPRGWTTSSTQRSPGAISPGANGDQPPSPSGAERSNGYGFPALRRTLSKRTSSTGPGASGSGAVGAGDASPSSASRTRTRRSSSQPPHPTVALEQPDGTTASRPTTANPSSPTGGANVTSTPSSTGGAPAADSAPSQRLRLVPHLESSRSLHFEPIERDLAPFAIVKVGRFTDRSNTQHAQAASSATDPARVAFKSKVVSRGHAEIWTDDSGKFFIKDMKSSSGTFLNHIRLSAPNTESRPFPLKDGDVLQLGVDYQGGTEEIYRCVKMRVELNRAWQRGANNFNTAALAQLRALGGGSSMEPTPTSGTAMTATSTQPLAPSAKSTPTPMTAAQQAAAAASITDCCICLYPYADLEADVEIDPPELPVEPSNQPEPEAEAPTASELAQPPTMAPVEETEEPASRAASIRSGRPGNSRRGSAIAVAGPDGLPPGITVTPHRGRSRPSSRAPSIVEALMPSETDDMVINGTEDVPEEDEEAEEDADSDPREGSSLPPSLPMPFSSNHLSAASPTDLYASLANATTPPNNTFLSTLANSSALHLTGPFTMPRSGDSSALGTPMSLDAAVEAVEVPDNLDTAGSNPLEQPDRTSVEASRSASGSGGEETDREVVEGEGSDADGSTGQASSSVAEQIEVSNNVDSNGEHKGKAKERDVTDSAKRDLESDLKKLKIDSIADEESHPSVST
ncbi:uncharacterized protein JCM15063_003790 [Sporobolomyces koalae]|uniref:uncharacterized protein n=1 Tax=Sporobolomyces koalae TaxID=500713 RepID=UPI003181CA5F